MDPGGKINFNAQHSPAGAFMSFTCGHFGTRGGIGVQIGKPANQDLYIGVKDGDRLSDATLKCLPFFQNTEGKGAADFQVEQAGPAEQNVAPKVAAFATDQIRRRYEWATDEWKAEDFTFTLHTPFAGIPDPAAGELDVFAAAIRPAIRATLRLDNRESKTPRTLVFAINFDTPGARLLHNTLPGNVAGFAHRRDVGVAGRVRRELTINGKRIRKTSRPEAIQGFNVSDAIAKPTPHPLGSAIGLTFTVPAGEVAELELSIGCYLDGIVTTGLEGRYAYTRHYGSLEQVLIIELNNDCRDECDDIDRSLAESGLSADQQFLIAHATRSYYGSTQLLDVAGEPFWIVNEGEYCMMNTLDLSVDQMFWELNHNPWVVKNQLDRFVSRYSYVDGLKSDGATPLPGGISFSHDMGAHNNFSPPGKSSYELPNLTGCFSYMTAEQLCNWVLIAATYVMKTDDRAWLMQNGATIRGCLDSLTNRTGANGMITFDSDRCGPDGAEITTYDSLDHSLAQTRNNAYMGTKAWASFIGLHLLCQRAGDLGGAELARERAALAGAALAEMAGEDGVIPAVFETDSPGHRSRILPIIEAMIYPLAWGVLETDALAAEVQSLRSALRGHTLALLTDTQDRNRFPDGGLKLSSTSNNSWMSKIAIFQHVAREVFRLDDDPAIAALFARADAAHAKWQIDGSGYWACSDQFVSGIAKGSRYYPRIITAALWLEGSRRGANRKGANPTDVNGVLST